MKTIYALIRNVGYSDLYKDNILLFESEKDRDNKLEEIIKTNKDIGYGVQSYEYKNELTHQFEYFGNDKNIILGSNRTFTWTSTILYLN